MKLKAIFAACISLMVMSSSANAGNLNNGEHGISARATSAKQLVDVYAGGNYVSISSSNMAIMFDIDNRDPERAPCVRLVVASLDNLGGGNERMTWEDITKQFKVKR